MALVLSCVGLMTAVYGLLQIDVKIFTISTHVQIDDIFHPQQL